MEMNIKMKKKQLDFPFYVKKIILFLLAKLSVKNNAFKFLNNL
jgi:hypothetical protein